MNCTSVFNECIHLILNSAGQKPFKQLRAAAACGTRNVWHQLTVASPPPSLSLVSSALFFGGSGQALPSHKLSGFSACWRLSSFPKAAWRPHTVLISSSRSSTEDSPNYSTYVYPCAKGKCITRRNPKRAKEYENCPKGGVATHSERPHMRHSLGGCSRGKCSILRT